MVYPNAPRATLVPGKYNVEFATDDKAQIKVDALIKRQSGVLQGGSLPVAFWFTKQNLLSATSAESDAAFQEAVSALVDLYGSVGIKVGPITYLDLPEPGATHYAVIQDFKDFPGLFALANKSDVRALNFFMVAQFNFSGGASILGISAGIPGPPAFKGLGHSGVVVSLAFLSDSVKIFGETLAHEGGHYLGLYHPSEKTGTTHDPLLDTPECTPSADTNQDGNVDARECVGKGSDNVMFWQGAAFPQRKVTNDQRFVLLRNPSLQ
jgi:hypothetical protein